MLTRGVGTPTIDMTLPAKQGIKTRIITTMTGITTTTTRTITIPLSRIMSTAPTST
jgi:hypothetical protein